MARIGLDLTQRMIVNQWVSFLDELGVLKSIPRLNGVKEMPDFEQVKDVPLLGYVYVDHDAGISLKVEGLYQSAGVHDPEIETISKFIRDSVSLKFRFDIIRMIDSISLTIKNGTDFHYQSLRLVTILRESGIECCQE